MTMFGSQWLANPDTGYTIDQSIRFNKSASGSMSRTFGTPTDRNKFTYAFWMKACSESNGYCLETNVSGTSGTNFSGMVFNGGSFQFFDYTSGSANIDVRTTFTSGKGKFRDYTAWYHAMFVFDSDESTDSDRLKLFVNGRQFPAGSLVGPGGGSPEWPTSGENSRFNASGTVHRISSSVNGLVDGYMADIYFIDGQALTPSSFGEFSSTTGEFVPIEYSGAFGNNGFYIDGRDSSDLGDDESGNGNDFSTSNMGTDDQVTDSPTNNFSIFNKLGSCNVSGQALTLSDGNLRSSASGTTNAIEAVGTIAATTGKYYAEFTLNAAPQLSNQYPAIGVIGIDLNITGGNNFGNSSFFGFLPNGNKTKGSTTSSYGDTYGNGDIIGIALDLDNQKIYFSKNGTYQNSGDPAAGSNAAFTDLVAGTQYRFCVSHAGSSATDVSMNAGQLPFNTAAPTGFSSMSTANLPNPTIADSSKHFDTKLWTGNDTDGRAITGYNFQPDWVWIKSRSGAYSHSITDAVRGAGPYIQSNTADAEASGPGAFGSTLAFTSDGYTLDNGTSDNLYVNAGSETYVGWAWEANGSGSSNSDGNLTATVSANATAGFSIIKYQGTGSATTVGHGLGVAPKMVIVKDLDNSRSWNVFHDGLSAATKVIYLDQNAAESTDSAIFGSAPTSSVVNIATGNGSNGSGINYIMYAFAEVPGFSKIGSYVGNGNADGTFVNCDFRPAWVMGKRIGGSGGYFDWWLFDSKRPGFNVTNERIHPNNNQATDTGAGSLDLVSNGFKIRTNTSSMNNSGDTIIFMAFAETPFKTSTAR